jgi:heme exporter protein A
MTLFSGENITSVRNGRIIFEKLSFGLGAGEIMALTGPNGTGKTSLLRIMGGLLDYQDGALSWHGKTINEAPPCHWLGAENPLKPKLSLWDNMAFWYDCYHAASAKADLPHDKEKHIIDALESMKIDHLKDTPVRYLSTGQKRRANLTRLFLQERPLWLLDEPATGLDFDTKQTLIACLEDHAKKGGIAVIATHRPDLWHAGKNLDMMEYRA